MPLQHIAACKRARQEVVRFNINTATRLLSRWGVLRCKYSG